MAKDSLLWTKKKTDNFTHDAWYTLILSEQEKQEY